MAKCSLIPPGFFAIDSLFVKYFSYGGQVDEFNGTSGAFVKTFAAANGGIGTSIAFSLNGQHFYNPNGSGGIDLLNATTGALITPNFIGPVPGLDGFVIGPDGDLYVRNTNYLTSTFDVLRFNGSTGAYEGQFVTNGSGGLGGGTGLIFGPDGNLYVDDSDNNVVREYNGTTGAFIRNFASGGGLMNPEGLAFGANGNLYVSGSINSSPADSVFQYNGTTGAFINVFATNTNANPTNLLFVTGQGSVPEPSAFWQLGSGFIGLAVAGSVRKRARRRQTGPERRDPRNPQRSRNRLELASTTSCVAV